jgi:SAM-dependent methyltransferase
VRPESVIRGKDRDVLPVLLGLHAVRDPEILDCTYNRGVMWKGLDYQPVTLDVDPQFGCDYTADFRHMPFDDDSFDVIIFDPPHLPAAVASPGSSGLQRLQYGLTEHGDYRQGDDIADVFVPFLAEAYRVLRRDGVVLAKIADFVHNHRYQWSHVDFIQAARDVGMTPCDVVIKADPTAANLKSSKWVNVRHLRRAHCYWIVVRNGRCEARLVA